MANALKAITTRAKQIYKKGGTWKGAIKKAAAERRNKPAARKRKPAKKARAKKPAVRKTAKRSSAPKKRSGLTYSGALATAKNLMLEKLGRMEVQKFKATTKTAKRKISKGIAAVKRSINKLQ